MRAPLPLVVVALVCQACAVSGRSSRKVPDPFPQGVFAITPSIALALVLPATWSTGVQPNDDRSDSLLFGPVPEKGFTLRVSPFPGVADARKMAEALWNDRQGRDRKALQEYRGERRIVYWFAVPAKPAPEPGEFRWLSVGAAEIDNVLVTFNLLHDAEEPPERALTLQALGRARQVDDRKVRTAGSASVAFGGRPWALLVDVPGLVLERGGSRPDGSAVVMGHSDEAGLVVSIFLEPAAGPGGPVECRAALFEKALLSPTEKVAVARSERGNMAIGEYLVPRFEGKEVQQKHVNAYLVRDGVWIDVHLSRLNARPGDDALFGQALGSIRFSDG